MTPTLARKLDDGASGPRKKARTTREGRSDTLSSAQPVCTHFLNTIPQEILENVLRFQSYLPRADHWVKHTPLNDVLQLYRFNRGLGPFLRRMHTLCVSKTSGCDGERKDYRWKIPDEDMLWTDSIDKAFDYALRAGEFLSTIIIGEDMYDQAISGRNMVEAFRRACPNVRYLSVAEKFDVWVSEFGAQVERLEIVSMNPTDAVPTYCPSLQELSLSSYNYFFPHKNIADMQWDIIGGKLESLMFSKVRVPDAALKRMREHCKHLKHIGFGSLCAANANIAGFIASYGDQIETITVSHPEQYDLSDIVEKCRKARFHVSNISGNDVLPTVRLLGPRLDGVAFRDVNAVQHREWAAAWNRCYDLEVLEAINVNVETMQGVMEAPKKYLKEVRIDLFENEEEDSLTEYIMNIVSEGTQCVETFHYICNGDLLNVGDFDGFVDKNRDTLRSVTIFACDVLAQFEIDGIATHFATCPRLQHISFDRVPSEGVLDMLRVRGIHFQRAQR